MTAPLPVVTDLADYRVAIAGLPLQAQQGRAAAGAVAVVDGAVEWWEALAGAIGAGAAAVVVAEPRLVPPEIAGDVARSSVPIVVSRARLRPDVLSMAVDHRDGILPRVTVVDCRATSEDLAVMVRDAAGWIRALSNSRLTVAAAAGRRGGTALVRSESDARIAGSMNVTVTRPEGMLLRVTALGEVTSEIEIDEPAGRSELATSTREGRRVAPSPFEASARLALRRAIEAVRTGAFPTDLADLESDAAVARTILR